VTPAARLQTAIEIVDDILLSVRRGGPAADTLIRHNLRSKRYAGSKDRAAIRDFVFRLLRDDAVLIKNATAREVAVQCALNHQSDLIPLFGAGGYGPNAISDTEKKVSPADKSSAQKSFLQSQLATAFGAHAEREYEALLSRATFDLRCGVDVETRDVCFRTLIEWGVADIEETRWSSWGIRLPADTHLPEEIFASLPMMDVQDEGSQIITRLTGAKPGETVIDLCAGAGGKTLALAAMMQGQGQLVAHDVDSARLDRMIPRAERAGVDGFIVRRSDDLADMTGVADVVLVDAPCTGAGTWRRSPEARLRLTAQSVARLVETQRRLILQAAGLVLTGGRIVFAVCSWLMAEGEDHLAHLPPDLRVIDWHELWPSDQPAPESASLQPKCLKLTPWNHNCDGFFIVCLEKLW
jgi:16S rRNA (cytosine967-C5)-methyltransferase